LDPRDHNWRVPLPFFFSRPPKTNFIHSPLVSSFVFPTGIPYCLFPFFLFPGCCPPTKPPFPKKCTREPPLSFPHSFNRLRFPKRHPQTWSYPLPFFFFSFSVFFGFFQLRSCALDHVIFWPLAPSFAPLFFCTLSLGYHALSRGPLFFVFRYYEGGLCGGFFFFGSLFNPLLTHHGLPFKCHSPFFGCANFPLSLLVGFFFRIRRRPLTLQPPPPFFHPLSQRSLNPFYVCCVADPNGFLVDPYSTRGRV